jgi:uncharacterized SAM-binding protein YcdF (DUF218 family)
MKRSSRIWLYGWALSLLFIFVVVAIAWANRVSLLQSAAAYWIVSDAEGPADAIAILGGGVETRPFAAALYYHDGLAHKILVSNVRIRKVEALGVLPLHADLNRAVLIKLGVPEADIELFGKNLSNTYEEVLALRRWALFNKAHSIIVPTEIFPSRRVRWIFNREFAGTTASLRIIALDDPDFSRYDWWRTKVAL